MQLIDLVQHVRSLTRDFSNSIFREEDIKLYINSGIDRFKQVIPELKGMKYLREFDDEVEFLPPEYHSLLAIYATSRCFAQDERHYQATTYMNEFETKLEELQMKVEGGEVDITDPDGNTVDRTYKTDQVVDNYFLRYHRHSDEDKGVEGVK